MLKPLSLRMLAFAWPLVLAASLMAQRYPERDHGVFHRPPPPAPAKQQTPTPAVHRTPVAATGTNNHKPEGAHHRESTYSPPPDNIPAPSSQTSK